MKKTLLIILIACSCSSAQVTKTVLANGVIYNWQIVRMNDFKTTDIYFNFKFVNANSETRGDAKVNYGYIGFVGVEELPELQDFVKILRLFANGTQEMDFRGVRFEVYLKEAIYIYDFNGNYIKLSKANAKALATDIEKSIYLYK